MFSILNDNNNYFECIDDYHDQSNVERICKEQQGFLITDFHSAVIQLFPDKTISILDVGCGAGWVINGFIENGYNISLGIDGCYEYYKYKCGPWGKYPNNFLNTNIAKPFTILYNEQPIQFDIINNSEFMEHIFPEDIDLVCQNIIKHMKDDGILIVNLSHRPCIGHNSIFPREWWIDKFKSFNLIENEILNKHFRCRYSRMPGDSYYFCFRKMV